MCLHRAPSSPADVSELDAMQTTKPPMRTAQRHRSLTMFVEPAFLTAVRWMSWAILTASGSVSTRRAHSQCAGPALTRRPPARRCKKLLRGGTNGDLAPLLVTDGVGSKEHPWPTRCFGDIRQPVTSFAKTLYQSRVVWLSAESESALRPSGLIVNIGAASR